MAWASIVSAMATRVTAAAPAFKVHGRLRWTNENSNEANWQTLFKNSSGKMAVAQITCTGRIAKWGIGQSARKIHYTAEIECRYAIEDSAGSEAIFLAAVDAIAENLRTGDRTLGGVAVAMSPPTAPVISHEVFAGVACHTARIQTTIEQVA